MLLIDSIRGRERNVLACNYASRKEKGDRDHQPQFMREGDWSVTLDQSNIHLMTLATAEQTNAKNQVSGRVVLRWVRRSARFPIGRECLGIVHIRRPH